MILCLALHDITGHRLDPPFERHERHEHASQGTLTDIYNILMLACWNEDPVQRPVNRTL